jgi:hypothetical protein
MTWSDLLRQRRVQKHSTTLREIDDLRAVVARDLADASVAGLSADRRFATAYNAALQLARMAVACAGYRIVGQGHHVTSFQALELAMGEEAATYAAYFDTCRRKRNVVDYDLAYVVSDTEAEELLREVEAFRAQVEAWIATNHPLLRAASGQ